MKKIYTFLILMFSCLIVESQSIDIMVTTADSGPQTYQARNSITFGPGYSYTPSGGTMTAEIIDPFVSGSISYQSIPNVDASLNTTYLAGATPGAFSVTPAGGASYTIPLKLTTGNGDFTPSLSLAYSNMAGPGVAGYGWNLQGISTITRGPQDLYHDDKITPVKFDWDDRLYLDGQRIVTTGNYARHEVVHWLANDNFTKIQTLWTNGNGPSQIEAHFKDGSRMRYGYEPTQNGRPILEGGNEAIAWYVTEASDRKGNYINYQYIIDGGIAYPIQISYSNGNWIFFKYKERDDKTVSYTGGYKFEQRLLLDKITINHKSSTNVIREYKLNYYKLSTGTNAGASILGEIIEYGAGGQRVNSTIFNYGTPGNIAAGAETTYHSISHIADDYNLFPGDYNGDGKTDIFAVNKSTREKWHLYLGQNNAPYFTLSASGTNSHTMTYVYAGDLNGDGKDDIFIIDHNAPIIGSGTIRYAYAISTGTGFGAITTFTTLNVIRNFFKKEHNYIGDYDGDGVPDCLTKYNNGSSRGWYLYTMGKTTGTNTTISAMHQKYYGTIPTWGDIDYVGDFNGDGKSDIWVFDSSGLKIYTMNGNSLTQIYSAVFPNSSNKFELGDFNGDGKTDMFIYGHSSSDYSQWRLYLSTGTGFAQNLFDPCKNNLRDDKVFVGDVNGDGRSDIIAFSKFNSQPYTYFFVAKPNGDGFKIISKQDAQLNKDYDFLPVDFNGDGKTDILVMPDGSGFRRKITTGSPEILLQKVRDGLNNKTTIVYSNLNDATCYQKGTASVGFPLGIYIGPMKAVKSVTNSGTGITSQTYNYQYEGLTYHKQGKGLLGHLKTKVSDVLNSTITETTQAFNTTYFYPSSVSSTKKTTANVLMETSSTSFLSIVLSSAKKQIFVYPRTSTHTNNLTNQTKKTDMVCAGTGNISWIANAYLDGSSRVASDSTVYAYGNELTASWFIGRPTKEITYHKRTGQPNIIKITDRTFSATSNLITGETFFPDVSAQTVHRKLEYDTRGVLTVDSLYSGNNKRVTRYYYNLGNPLLKQIKHPTGEITSFTYNDNGLLIRETDHLGNQTGYEYDALGRVTKETLPDGFITSTAYVWTGDIKPANAVFGIVQSGNDNSKSTQWFNSAQMVLRNVEKSFIDNMKVLTDTEYDSKNRLYITKYPYFSGATIIVAETYGYDSYGRLSSVTRDSGRNTTISYSTNKVTETTGGKTSWKITDAQGLLKQANDNGGTIAYTYYADGNLKSIVTPDDAVTSMKYDIAGNRTELVDPSAGTTTCTYDAFGQLLTHKNGRNHTTSYTYNTSDGRLNTKTTPEGTTTYVYDGTKKYLKSITSPNSVSRTYNYDTKGRVISTVESITGETFTTSVTYDNLGRLSTRTHPSGITETMNYKSTSGHLESISAGGAVRYQITMVNANGQVTGATQGVLKREFGFDTHGYPTYIKAKVGSTYKQDYRYVFNTVTGNLTSRQNYLVAGLTETFTYDNLDRLTKVTKGTATTLQMGYAANGNITSKSDIGTTFEYGITGKPYQLSAVESSTNVIPLTTQTADYTSFEKVNTVAEGIHSASFIYDSDEQRAKMTAYTNGATPSIRWYPTAGYMKETVGSMSVDYTWIGGDAYTAPVAAQKSGSSITWYNVLRDHLGSVTHLVDASGNVTREFSYDAWGRGRDKNDWSYTSNAEVGIFAGRGFAGHEYLFSQKLYNMNGRLYDPLVGRFLSPDPYVQMPDFTQNFNRYSYCWNNPLKYTDPSGEFIHIAVTALVGGIINTVSNWSEISKSKNPLLSGLSYFGVGALSYGVAAAVPALAPHAMGFMAGGNIALDIAHGSLPSFDKPGQVAMYAVGVALDAVGVKSAPGMANAIQKGWSRLTSEVMVRGSNKIVSREIGSFAVEGAEWAVIGTRTTAVKPITNLAVSLADDAAKVGWKVGKPITNLTVNGNMPAWSTVRQRFWKNEAFFSKAGDYSEFNMLRMKKGLAPQFRNPVSGILESMELHHTIPQRKGGLFEFIKMTPDQHRLIDPFRK